MKEEEIENKKEDVEKESTKTVNKTTKASTETENTEKKGPWHTIVICILIIAICVCAYFVAKYIIENNNGEDSETTESTEISDEAIFTVDNYPTVDCSTATIPMATAFMANFTNTDEDELEITSSKTDGAYTNLINGDADVILVVEPSEDEMQAAEDAGVELVSYKVANEGFVFFTNTQNVVDNLSLEQIQKIYTGEITNWSEVGGDDVDIIAYQRPENSGSQTGMLSLVMNGLTMMEATTETIAQTMGDIINLVADYENNAGAIGYSYYYYANTMYAQDEIKLLSVNGVEPTNETIRNEEYPIQTAYYIVMKKSDEDNEEIMSLVNAMLSDRGQQVVEEAGYVSIK